ncbi:unnamed protein product, partial [Symbiodinium sp. CCMP2456]
MVAQRKLNIHYNDSSKFTAKLVVDSNWPFTGCQGVKDARVIAGTVTCSFEPRVQDVSDGKRFIYYKLADAELHKKLSKSVLAAAHIDLAVLNDHAEVYFTNPQSVSLLAWLSSSPTCLEFKLKAFAADVHHGLDFFDRSASPLSDFWLAHRDSVLGERNREVAHKDVMAKIGFVVHKEMTLLDALKENTKAYWIRRAASLEVQVKDADFMLRNVTWELKRARTLAGLPPDTPVPGVLATVPESVPSPDGDTSEASLAVAVDTTITVDTAVA